MLANSNNSYIIHNNPQQHFQSHILPKNSLIINEYPVSKVSKNNNLSKSEIINISKNAPINPVQNNKKESNIMNINSTVSQNINISNKNSPQQNSSQENNNINSSSKSLEDKKSINPSQLNTSNKGNNIQKSQQKQSLNPINKSIQQPQKKNKISKFTINPNCSLMGKKIEKAMPVYNLINEGKGISRVEEQGIIFCAMTIYQEEMQPLSNNTAKYIQTKLGGDWLVIIYPEGKSIDYYLTSVSRNDFMIFTLDTTAYHVCRLR